MESNSNSIDEIATMPTSNTLEAKGLPNNDSTSTITIETKPTADNNEHAINCGTVKATEVNVLDNSVDSNVSLEDELNSAMTSVAISTTDTNEVKQNLDVSNITLEPNDDVNSTNTGEFEDAHEYVDEEDIVEKTHEIKNSAEDGLSDEETNLDKEKNEEIVITAPVPVDDDTNDPQYIPRRGRFYEHDDRMAYSTTSSEESEFSDEYDEDNSDGSRENSSRRRNMRRHTSNRIRNTIVADDATSNNTTTTSNEKLSSKKVLAISKAAASMKNTSETTINSSNGSIKKPGNGFRKSRDIDSLDKWTHDMYDEHDQTRKTRDELLASYGYDIREESEAPRARRHHKYGRAATSKYTRNWQDTKAYVGNGSQSSNVNHRVGWRNSMSNKNKSTTSDKYTSEFPSLNGTKKLEDPVDAIIIESPSAEKDLGPSKSLSTDLPINNSVDKTPSIDSSPHTASSFRGSEKLKTPPSNKNYPQNGGSSTSYNKNHFQRSSVDSSVNKEKNAQVNRVSLSGTNSNFYKRSQYNDSNNQNNNYKHQPFNNTYGTSRGHNHNHQNAVPSRGRNFQHNHNNQYNRDRYFSKGATPFSSNPNNSTTAGTGRTQHSGGHFNRKYDNENEQLEPLVPAPVVRSSKRYSVQSNRELPDPVLNFGGINKTSQQQTTLQQIQPQPQMQPSPQALQLQSQIHQAPSMQLQQFHQPLQPMHQHHRMVLDHNSGIMVMATADPSMYHHQLYTTPQYANTIAPGSSTGNAEDQNAALQMLAAQAAVYQPVPTGTAITTPASGVQPDSFMTTYYQPQPQTSQQPPPRRVNLAIPIVAPPEHGVSKSSPIPAQTTSSTN